VRSQPADTVLFVTHTRHFGGSAVSLRTVLRNFPAGIRRAVAAPDGRMASGLVAEGLVDHRVAIPWEKRRGPLRVVVSAAGAARVTGWTLRRRRRLAAVHANSLADLVIAAPGAALGRVPVIVWVHDDDATTRRARHVIPIARRLGCRVRLVAVSRAGADALVECGLTDAGDVTVVPNPIDRATVVADHHAAADVVRIGFVGTDTLRKGFELLPDILGRLDRPAVRLLVFSRHHQGRPAAVEQAWEALGRAHPRVELVGRQDDVRAAYARCDIVLCPSRQESFCRVAAEAMANGLPVVASDLAAVREVLGDGQAGLLFPAGDASGAVNALRRLVDDPGLRRRLGEAGRSRARSFDPDDVVRRLTGLYFNGRSMPPPEA
jgi:glycosyltransferase involved in cell wall biosynthesis